MIIAMEDLGNSWCPSSLYSSQDVPRVKTWYMAMVYGPWSSLSWLLLSPFVSPHGSVTVSWNTNIWGVHPARKMRVPQARWMVYKGKYDEHTMKTDDSEGFRGTPTSGNTHMGVSWNRGTPKSSILVGFSLMNQPFRIPPFMETSIYNPCSYPGAVLIEMKALVLCVRSFGPSLSHSDLAYSLKWNLSSTPLVTGCCHFQGNVSDP